MYKKLLIVISIFLPVSIVMLVCGLWYVMQDLRYYSEYALQPIAKKTGLHISFDDMSWHWSMGLGVRIHNIKIIHAASQTTVLDSNSADIRLQLFPLLQKKIVVSKIILDTPRIILIRNEDGSWPIDWSSYDRMGTAPAFSFMVNQCLIHDGELTVDDRLTLTKTQLHNLTFEVRRHFFLRKYLYSFSAERKNQEFTTRISSTGTIGLSTGSQFPANITGSGTLVLQKLALADYAPYMMRWFSGFSASGYVDVRLECRVTAGFIFETEGWIKAEPLILQPAHQPAIHIARWFYTGNMLVSPTSITLRNAALSLPGLSMKGTAVVTGLPSKPCMNAQVTTDLITVQTIKQMLPQSYLALGHLDYYRAIADGAMAFKKLSLKTGITADGAMTLETLDGQGEIHHLTISIRDTLPQLKCEHGVFNITKEQLTLTAIAAQWLPNDVHIINGVIRQPLENPALDVRITSTVPADAFADALPLLFPDRAPIMKQWVAPGTGIIHLESQIQYPETARRLVGLSATIDLGNVNYTIGDYVRKPFGVPNALTLQCGFTPGEFPAAVDWSFTLQENALVLAGSVSNLSDSITATYQLQNMNARNLHFLFLPAALQYQAVMNGSGTITIPIVPFTAPQITGNISLHGLTLQRIGDDQPFFTLDTEGAFQGNQFHVSRASGTWGRTRITGSGDFIFSADPQVVFNADVPFLDLDDFIETVIMCKKMMTNQNDSKEAPLMPRTPEKTFFRRLVLNAPAHVHQGEFLSWRFADGTTDISLKNGIMTYGDIKLQAYQGTITGSVVHDFSQPGIYRLTLLPTATGIRFEEFLPELKENNVISGKLDLTGSYTSQFKRDFEIVPHMEGTFTVLMKDATLGKFTVISKIFSLLNLSEMIKLRIPDVLSQGMPLDTLTGTFRMTNGIAHTDDLFIKSPAMNLSAVGDIIFPKKEIDFIIGVQPLETIGKIIGSIPIAGKILTGENKSITVSYFQVQGPYTEAVVKPVPVESLNRGVRAIFKRVYRLPQEILSPSSKLDKNASHDADMHTSPK